MGRSDIFMPPISWSSIKIVNVLGSTILRCHVWLYAFPDMGVPNYSPIGPQVDRCMVYAIVRTESGFDQRDMSSAKAVGLMCGFRSKPPMIPE